ncbi:LacI family DNA-binding transcriptional regulator [Clostridium tertium]|uniref:Putative HTH-type transcriptional repressor ExuR n=1 Tax=Clostridium tertium TaxID=1559 RepID=A0A6N3B0Y8_9CLOT
MQKKITMNDIAKHLGISKNAVSQALSGKDGVSENTRMKVIETAESLGYVYKKSKSLDTRKISLVGSSKTFSLDFFGSICLNIQSELNNLNIDLTVIPITDEYIENNIIPQGIYDSDGILILSHITDNYIKSIASLDMPCVLIDHHIPNLNVDCVLTNNRFGTFSAIEHLIDLGHTKIGFLGEIDYSPSYYERLEGYKLAFYKRNLNINNEYIFTNVSNDIDLIIDIIKSLGSNQPTAWFCANDKLGCLLLNALREFNYSIPEDISICSFDNAKFSNLMVPKITSVDIPKDYLAKKAIELLLSRLSNSEDPYQEVLVSTNLVVKDSTAAL